MLNFVPVVVHGKAADESQIDSRNGSQSNLNCSELQEAAYETLTSLAERSRKGDVPRPVLHRSDLIIILRSHRLPEPILNTGTSRVKAS